MAKKKTTKVPEGITYKRTKTGINVTISQNGRIIAVLRGYNNTANMHKGIGALWSALHKSAGVFSAGAPLFTVTDLTPKKKK